MYCIVGKFGGEKEGHHSEATNRGYSRKHNGVSVHVKLPTINKKFCKSKVVFVRMYANYNT